MARKTRTNRKKSKERGFIFPIPLAAVLMTAALLSLSYLWLCGRCETLGQQIKKLEEQRIAIEKRRLNEEYKWSNMKSPRNIERALRRHNLEMYWPNKTQVVRLPSSSTSIASLTADRDVVEKVRVAMND